ncbi:hypothetical protein CGRA01v4_05207 [Colletotrichum graminicola]|nr:hypothetical protein CGRA01v4_05207 [Colletotrichum graminicola]
MACACLLCIKSCSCKMSLRRRACFVTYHPCLFWGTRPLVIRWCRGAGCRFEVTIVMVEQNKDQHM